ncbi:hypothetical protein K6W37_07315 [Acetobacter senegalensis]|uniref:hypothetical protein n=1 Tax=Acetobacter senegalensis TaxID=446692 RepID=UPI001EDAE063|nr:hypothetical protein [Acetobacter senegalensis]MCG4253707.1 hypothetical protein [Acetobacter senegalensis]
MNSGASTIEIEGDFAKKIIRLKATGNVAWPIAFGAIGLAVAALIVATPATVATGGLAAPVEGVSVAMLAAPAVAIIGLDVVVMSVGLAITAGGVGILSRLRSDYKVVEQTPTHVMLVKR